MGVNRSRNGPKPERPFFFVSNHISWLDSIVFSAELGAVFVPDAGIQKWPVIGPLLAALGMVFINRKMLRDIRRAGRKLMRHYGTGEGIVFFPEADTTDGTDIKPFRPGLFEGPCEAGIPVYWGILHYTVSPPWGPASKRIAWTDWTPFPVHAFRALKCRRCTAGITYGPVPVYGPDRKSVSSTIERKIKNGLMR